MAKIKRLLAISVPIKQCNLKCHYCYIAALKDFEKKKPVFNFSPEHVGECLSKERLGGECIINLTGGGETLLPAEMPAYIKAMLEQGHFLEVVTNGTLTKRFDEIEKFPNELLKRLEFKFSFHYLELKRLGLLDKFFENVKKMRDAGCSITVECTPTDELEPYMEELKEICIEKVGALCQLTIARNDLDDMKVLSKKSNEEYFKTWESFGSDMFAFKQKLFGVKRKEFCYAGMWSLYIDLGTGRAKQCYGQLYNQNIFKDKNEEIKFEPVGKHCRQKYCYNGHAFLSLGLIPELTTPTYADIRNRKCIDGSEWEGVELKESFSDKLYRNNTQWNEYEKEGYEKKFFIRMLKDIICDMPEFKEKVLRKIRRKIK